jgi:hypothetical protein
VNTGIFSLHFLSARKNFLALSGGSPCPVVEQTHITTSLPKSSSGRRLMKAPGMICDVGDRKEVPKWWKEYKLKLERVTMGQKRLDRSLKTKAKVFSVPMVQLSTVARDKSRAPTKVFESILLISSALPVCEPYITVTWKQ